MITDNIYDLLIVFLGYKTTGDSIINTNTIINTSDTTGINIGDVIIGDFMEAGSTVTAKTVDTITVSSNLLDTNTFGSYFTHKSNIFVGQQNNYVVPTDNSFITITELDAGANGVPMRVYDSTLEKEFYVTADTPMFQLDFYGSFASNTAKRIRTVLKSPLGTNYLAQYGSSVYQVKDIQNLTDALDYQEYVYRYSLRFSLFSNTVVNNDDLATIEIDNQYYLAEVQT